MINDIINLIKNEWKYFIDGVKFELSKNKGELIRVTSRIIKS